MRTAAPPAARHRFAAHRLAHVAGNILHDGAFDLDGIILLRLRAVAGVVLGGEVNAADERDDVVHHHDFPVQAAEDIGAHPHHQRTRIVIDEAHAFSRQAVDEFVREIRRAVAVHHHLYLHAALCGGQQFAVQRVADLILKQDKGFQHHAALGALNRAEHAREKFFAVFQQTQTIAFSPFKIHRWISTASGA